MNDIPKHELIIGAAIAGTLLLFLSNVIEEDREVRRSPLPECQSSYVTDRIRQMIKDETQQHVVGFDPIRALSRESNVWQCDALVTLDGEVDRRYINFAIQRWGDHVFHVAYFIPQEDEQAEFMATLPPGLGVPGLSGPSAKP